jgi:hypothetical protein
MLKGKSTVELFDGITGKKKEEFINPNIVTNAISNMLDFGNELSMRGVSIDQILDRVTPLYPNFLRGILLWDRIVPENADNILPPPGIKCVGHAGGGYSGSNPLRGTLNEAETVNINNGVRMVWDFATDKANGTIKSISLTSVLGGDRGWMTPWEPGTFFRARINNTAVLNQAAVNYAPHILATTISGISFAYVGELRRGIHTYIADRNDNCITIIEQTYTNPNSIGLFDNAGVMTHNPPYCKETQFSIESDARFANINSNIIINEDNNLVHVVFSGAGNRIARIRIANLITKTIVSDRTITLDRDVLLNAAAFFKNRLYANSGGGICEFDENGRFIKQLTNFTVSLRYYCFAGDYLASQFNSASTGLLLNDGVNTILTQVGHDSLAGLNVAGILNAAGLKRPLFVSLSETGVKTISYVTPYMATINNLATEVIKTDQNTMKITYELTQE